MSALGADRSIVLLHEQLQDARVWRALTSEIGDTVTVHTVAPPPIHTLGAPAAWADHIGHHARAAIAPDTVDLAVAISTAGEAAVGMTADGHVGAALLLDPDTTALLADPTGLDRPVGPGGRPSLSREDGEY